MDEIPVLLIAYNRPELFQRTIESLAQNEETEEFPVYICIDGPKDKADEALISKTCALARKLTGFKSVTALERSTNVGLAKNILEGINTVLSDYDKIIVVEDDIYMSKNFLRYMRSQLNFHEDNPKVWHISGWNYPIHPLGLPETFAWRGMNCWGWGTWRNRWEYLRLDAQYFMRKRITNRFSGFNLNGVANFSKQLEDNARGKKKTWAIFWYATIYENRGLCINPTRSLTFNIGFGDHATNTKSFVPLQGAVQDSPMPAAVTHDSENTLALQRIKRYYIRQKLARMGHILFPGSQ